MNLSKPEIQLLLTLEPEEIIKWFQAKGYTLSWDWHEVEHEAHARSFTVAKVMKLDILKDIKEAADQIFKKGITYNQFQKELEPILRRKGWWGKMKAKDVPGYVEKKGVDPNKMVQLGSPRRLEIIYRTNMKVGYSSGRYKRQVEHSKLRPYLMYIQLQRASKREVHSIFHELVFMYDDPIWDILYPPNGWECGCRVKALSKQEFDALGIKVSKGSDYMEQALAAVPEEWRYNPGKAAFNPDLTEYKDFL